MDIAWNTGSLTSAKITGKPGVKATVIHGGKPIAVKIPTGGVLNLTGESFR